MRILILGGDGMLGHQLFDELSAAHEVKVTLRQNLGAYAKSARYINENAFCAVDVRAVDRVAEVLSEYKPAVVINGVGLVKQRHLASEAIPSIEINALVPHKLAVLCRLGGARFIHVSTDCVFSGSDGDYKESDFADAVDLYGRTKYLGEVHDQHCITLRTSIIGLELARYTGLIEWFLAQSGQIRGYTRAIYSGLTTRELSRVIGRLIAEFPALNGVWHVASKAISKYELLQMFSEKLQRRDIEIVPYEEFICDRSLNGSRFNEQTGYQAPAWSDMLDELASRVLERGNNVF